MGSFKISSSNLQLLYFFNKYDKKNISSDLFPKSTKTAFFAYFEPIVNKR